MSTRAGPEQSDRLCGPFQKVLIEKGSDWSGLPFKSILLAVEKARLLEGHA